MQILQEQISVHTSRKESIQRKGDPDAAYFLRSSLSTEVAERGSCPFVNVRHPCRTPYGLFPPKAPVLGAAYGINPTSRCHFRSADAQRTPDVLEREPMRKK